MRIFQVYEHDTILVGDTRNGVSFDQSHFASLSERLGKKDDSEFPFYSLVKYRRTDGIRFKQYVGAIQAGDLTIEILPKADKESVDQDWKSILLFMLAKIFRLNIYSENDAPQKLRTSTILEFVLSRFLDEVEMLMHQGLVKTYRTHTENQTSLTGRLLFSKQLTKNLVHKERFFVQHDVYDRSHIMNRIIRQTLACIAESSSNVTIRQRASRYLVSFSDLPGVNVEEKLFIALKYDRKTQRYKDAMALSELILFNNMPNLSGGNKNTFAMLFDMNRLWEEFVYVTLRKYLKGYTVTAQVRRKFWEKKCIKPDIVLHSVDDPQKMYVLDTKWKKPDRMIPADADLHQMYVYFRYFNACKVALLYPSAEKSNGTSQPIYAGKFTDDLPGSCDLIYLPVPKWDADGKKWQQEIVDLIRSWLRMA